MNRQQQDLVVGPCIIDVNVPLAPSMLNQFDRIDHARILPVLIHQVIVADPIKLFIHQVISGKVDLV